MDGWIIIYVLGRKILKKKKTSGMRYIFPHDATRRHTAHKTIRFIPVFLSFVLYTIPNSVSYFFRLFSWFLVRHLSSLRHYCSSGILVYSVCVILLNNITHAAAISNFDRQQGRAPISNRFFLLLLLFLLLFFFGGGGFEIYFSNTFLDILFLTLKIK